MCLEINFTLGKNGGYIPSNLGGRLISVGRQAVRKKFLQFDNFNSVNSKLFEYIHAANSSVETDLRLVFEGNVIVRLFSEPFSFLQKP